VLIVLALFCRESAAEERAALIVRVAGTPVDALVERIRGQVSDLPIVVRTVELDAPADERARAALRLGREEGAVAVVWLEPLERGALLVCVIASESGELLVRRLDAPTDRADAATSERLETAAVVVRATLEALLETGRIGAPSSPPSPGAEAPPPPGSAAPPSAPPPRTAPRPASPVRPSRAITSRAALGWLAVIDGQTPAGLQGPLARVEVRRKNVGLGLQAALSLPATIDDGVVQLQLVRTSLGADAVLAWPLGRALAIEGHVGGGITSFHRSTASRPEAGVAGTPDQTAFTVELTSDVLFSIEPLTALPAFRVVTAAGAALLLAPPRYDFRTTRGIALGPALWAVQPRFTAGLGWVF
jgi:hypothetical protein